MIPVVSKDNHDRPVDVTNSEGSCSAGNDIDDDPNKYICANLARRDPLITPIAGAKLARFLRIDDVKYRVLGRFIFNTNAVPNVVAQVTSVSNAIVVNFVTEVTTAVADVAAAAAATKVTVTSPTACVRNNTDTKTENISSVQRVNFETKFDADVTANTVKNDDAIIPVNPYKDKNGICNIDDTPYNAAMNATTGPFINYYI
jgi:hypothetical protein